MSTSISQSNYVRISLNGIQKATNNFSENNIIGKSDFGYIYEGQLLISGKKTNVSARRLDCSQGLGDIEFLTEISVLSDLYHANIVSLIGFCDEEGEKIIIQGYEAKRSLGMYLSDPALAWYHRMKIAIGVANAISYLHYEEGRNYSIIHRNINSSTILFDDNFEAKLSGFEFSIKHSVDRMERYISSEVIGTQGYMAPEVIKGGDPTQMSDVYSYGVVLCEILCGRKAFLPDEIEDNKFLAPLVRFHHENETLVQAGIIHPDLRNQINSRICSRFGKLACDCTKEDPVERPDMSQILTDLCEIYYNDGESFALGLSYAEGLKVTPSNAVQQQQQKSRPSNAWKVKDVPVC